MADFVRRGAVEGSRDEEEQTLRAPEALDPLSPCIEPAAAPTTIPNDGECPADATERWHAVDLTPEGCLCFGFRFYRGGG
jgi:hypothetical protein